MKKKKNMKEGITTMVEQMAQYIDHTLLTADATKEQIKELCQQAKEYKFKSVCINPTWVSYASELLAGAEPVVCTVIGFPLGANSRSVKAYEVKQAIGDGAKEVDMVINIGALKSGDFQLVKEDIQAVVQAAGEKALVKVIIETAFLEKNEKIQACELAKEAGADFVKTSTGFSTAGARVEDIQLMRASVGPELGVKASGGVRTKEQAQEMIEAGATRIGASNGIALL